MTKLIALLKRKPGISKEDFIAHYENNHAPLILRHFGDHIIDYTRSYLDYGHPLSYAGPGKEAIAGEAPFDVVTTLRFRTPADLDAMMAVGRRPEVSREIAEDEEKFLDRTANQIIISPQDGLTQGRSR